MEFQRNHNPVSFSKQNTSKIYTGILFVLSCCCIAIQAKAQGPMPMFHALNQNLPLLNQNLGTTVDVAYSTRKLRNEYTGFAMKVRRSGGGNPEANVMFEPALKQVMENSKVVITKGGGGYSVGDTAVFSDFYGSRSVQVMTWYDQSGSGNDATQSTTSARPYIVTSGSMIKENGIATLEFTDAHTDMYLGLNSSLSKSSGTMIAVCRVIGTSQTAAVADNGSYSYNINTWENSGYIGCTRYGVADVPSSISYSSSLGAIMWSKSSSGSNIEINTPTQSTTISATYPIAASQIYGNAVSGTTVHISEFLISSYASTSSRSNTFTNQRGFFHL